MSRFRIIDTNDQIVNNSQEQKEDNTPLVNSSQEQENKPEEVKINNVIQLPLIQEPLEINSQEQNEFNSPLVNYSQEQDPIMNNQENEEPIIKHKLFGVSHYAKKNISSRENSRELSDVNLRRTEIVEYEKNKKPNYGLLIIGGGAVMSILAKLI